MRTDPTITRVCPEQVHPLTFCGLLKWIDGRPLLNVMEPYRQKILTEALFTFRPDGAPLYKRVLTGRAKKNSKTTDAVLVALYRLLAWKAAGNRGNQVYFVASDLAQANDALDLCKKLVACNPVLANEVTIYRNLITRHDGHGFIEILASGDAPGLHGKTYGCYVHSELHTQKDYRVLEALELDRTRPDAIQWFESYAAVSPTPGKPINDILKQHEAKTDPRLFVSWYSGSVEEANPSLNGPLGPMLEDIGDAQRSLPSWIFRRLYQNLPGQPDGAAFDADMVEAAIVKGRTVLAPQPGLAYVAFDDHSGGGADDATLAIAHDHEGIGVLDLVIDQGPRTSRTFSPEETVRKFSEVLKQYGCFAVTGDRYAAQWPVRAFEKCGITYRPAELNRSQLYSALEPLLNSGQVELLDHPKLLAQLIGLVRKGEKIDHQSGEHDDWSNAAAGGLVLAQASGAPFAFYSGGRSISATPVVKTITAAVSSVVDTVSDSLTTTAKAIGKALSNPPARPVPMRRRTFEEMVHLMRNDLTDEEQQRFDEETARRQRNRQPSALDQAVRAGHLYWPSDGPPAANPGDLATVMEEVRARFAQWK